ncbi:MAG: exodeoxyribonuclease VII small subunit [Acidobacteria bacterium]|nr:exodeoxyribonuclease VII small subunit [Acidobacteriota bacterium]
MSNQPEPAGYAEALAELEDILADLESADVDVDVLATKVQRATQLIAFCRERIGSAKLQIETAVAGLADGD